MSKGKRIRNRLSTAATLAAIVLAAISLAGCGGGGGGGGAGSVPTGSIRGVALEGSKAVSGAAVWVNGVKTFTTTASDGTFTLTGVAAGTVKVTVVSSSLTGEKNVAVSAGMTANVSIPMLDTGPPGPPPI